MENEAMDQVLSQGEREDSCEEDGEHNEKVKISPIDLSPVAGKQNDGNKEDIVPFIMGKHLKEGCFEHARRVNEQPMGRINNF